MATIRWASRGRGAPLYRISPPAAGTSPARVVIRVVLPAPLAPTTAATLPSGTSRLTPWRARICP